MRVAVHGLGAVGLRAARQLASCEEVDRVVVQARDAATAHRAATVLGAGAVAVDPREHLDVDVVVVAVPAPLQVAAATDALERGAHVVSTADTVEVVEALVALDERARRSGRTLAVGAGFAPGLACVLAQHAASSLDAVDEVHVARAGTGGPACARAHHEALTGRVDEWADGRWVPARAGTGRQVCWFPEPIGGRECSRAALPIARLLVPALAGVQTVTARVAENRRDRLTARLPMLRSPHPDGGPGALRVEVRGRVGATKTVRVLGAMDRPSVAAGAVAALAAIWAGAGRLHRTGAAGLAELADAGPFLAELARRGVKAAAFEGAPA